MSKLGFESIEQDPVLYNLQDHEAGRYTHEAGIIEHCTQIVETDLVLIRVSPGRCNSTNHTAVPDYQSIDFFEITFPGNEITLRA